MGKDSEREQATLNRIGRYEIREELGRGGMGIVYKAYEPTLKRYVAIKVLSPALANQPEVIARLRHEASSAARLRHPNIVYLFEFIEENDLAYLVMEYAPGLSLSQLMENGPIPIPRAIKILEQIADALDYAHLISVIHRDVKPNNIIVGADDHAMLVDFGLAVTKDEANITPDGVILGTPGYMSPEQASGRDEIPKSDQYSLAAVAFEMLTGKPPFHYQTTPAIIHAHIYELPPHLTEINPSLPVQVNYVFNRALSKSTYERYFSVKDFVDDVRTALEPPQKKEKTYRIRKTVLWLAVVIFLIGFSMLAAYLGGFFPAIFNLDAGKNQLNLSQKILWKFNPGFVGGSHLAASEGRLIIGRSDGQLTALQAENGSVLWQTKDKDVFYGYPSADSELVFIGDQSEHVKGLSARTGGAVWSTKVTGNVKLAPLLYQNKLIAVTSKGYIFILNAGNGRVIWSRPLEIGITGIAVARNYLLIGYNSLLYALDLENGMVKWEYEVNSPFTTRPVVYENVVLIGTEQGRLQVINLEEGVDLWYFQVKGEIKASPVVINDVLFVCDQSGKVTALSLKNRTVIWEREFQFSIESAPVEAGGYLYIGSSSGKIFVVQKDSGILADEIQLNAGIDTDLVKNRDLIFIRADRIYALKP